MACSFQFVNSSPCGSAKSDVFLPVSQCKNDCTNHLVSLGVSETRGREQTCRITEEDLILSRSGLALTMNEKEMQRLVICPNHRDYLTRRWPGLKRKTCSYPTHTGRKTLKSIRRVTKTMSEEIYKVFGEIVPIGSGRYCYSNNEICLAPAKGCFYIQPTTNKSIFTVVCDNYRKGHKEVEPLYSDEGSRGCSHDVDTESCIQVIISDPKKYVITIVTKA